MDDQNKQPSVPLVDDEQEKHSVSHEDDENGRLSVSHEDVENGRLWADVLTKLEKTGLKSVFIDFF